jgi:thiamine biosynthesis lipoprotein
MPRLRTVLPVVIAFCCLSGSLSAQVAGTLRRYEFVHPQMGTLFKLVFFASNDTVATRAAKAAFDRVDDLNLIFSDYLPESELNRLCAKAGTGEKVPVSDDLWRILKLADCFSRKSAGAFDITVGACSRIWRRARHLNVAPDPADLRRARRLTGFRLIRFDKKHRKVKLKKPGMQLDLGGIAPGYAADECLRILRACGIRAALADAGGDIAAGDPPPGRTGWEIAFPVDAGAAQRTLIIKNCGITTSGATYRYMEINGVRYSHILDPRTGWGLTHRILVTVQAPDATTADAWATALSVSGKRGLEKKAGKCRSLRVWLHESDLKLSDQ